MTDTNSNQHVGAAGVALVALRHSGTAAQIAVAPYVVFFTLTDGEGSLIASSKSEAHQIASAMATGGMAHGTRIALALREYRLAEAMPCQGCGADSATDTCCESRQPRPIQQWLD
jgi:hypothetical protein